MRGSSAAAAVPAQLDTVSSTAARELVVDPRLVEGAVRDGYDQGFEEGYAHGRELAFGDAQGAIQDLQTRLTSVTVQLAHAADALLVRETTARGDIEDQLVAAAVLIAEQLLGRELREVDGRGRDAIARALALAPVAGHVIARLHPEDAAAIEDSELLAPGRALQVVADPGLRPGDAVVEVGACRIDARIDDALARVHEVLG
jgi:flagellar assembly protein FliH